MFDFTNRFSKMNLVAIATDCGSVELYRSTVFGYGVGEVSVTATQKSFRTAELDKCERVAYLNGDTISVLAEEACIPVKQMQIELAALVVGSYRLGCEIGVLNKRLISMMGDCHRTITHAQLSALMSPIDTVLNHLPVIPEDMRLFSEYYDGVLDVSIFVGRDEHHLLENEVSTFSERLKSQLFNVVHILPVLKSFSSVVSLGVDIPKDARAFRDLVDALSSNAGPIEKAA